MSKLQPKLNHKKGIASAARARRRAEAEERNAKYQALPVEQKIARNSVRVHRKLGVA